jgi:hypothetical protein
MPKSFNGATQPYATPADMLSRFDANLLGMLVRDDRSQASPTELLTEPRILTALADASGDFEDALTVGSRYAPADIAAIPSGSPAGNKVRNIVCGIALQYLRWARGIMEPAELPMCQRAFQDLERLHHGHEIFAFVETEEAGVASVYQMQPADYFNGLHQLMSNWQRYFGMRSNRGGPPYSDFGFLNRPRLR